MSVIAIPGKDSAAANALATARRRRPLLWGAVYTVAFLALLGGVIWFAKGKGWKTWLSETFFPGTADVYRVRPYAGEKGVLLNEFVAADVHIPHFGAGVEPDSLNAGGVTLTRVRDGATIPAQVNTSGAGDSIVLSPIDLLDPGTEY